LKVVWILNHYAQIPGGPGGTRHHSMAQFLPEHGWIAYILAASVELNTGYQRLGNLEKSHLMSLNNGEGGFLWVRTPTYKGNGVDRLTNMLVYSLRVILPSTTRVLPKADVIVGSSVHPFAAVAGLKLSRRHRVPFIFEVRDLWPQTLIDMGRLRAGSALAVFLHWMEKWLYKRSDRIITLLPYAKDYISALGIEAQRVIWIPNGVDLSHFPESPVPKKRKAFTLMYFGAHGNANGLENVLNAMRKIESHFSKPSIHLRLIGDGPRKAGLIAQAKRFGLRHVHFEKPVPKNRLPSIASEADAFVFNLVDAAVFRFGISSNKLFDFMASSRPIIFCCNAANNPVKEAGAGITVAPEDPTALAEAIISLVGMPRKERQAMGSSGRRYVEEKHDFQLLARKLANTLDELHGA
jgi:glycosyltransferase involved in cell wall biosynthesis